MQTLRDNYFEAYRSIKLTRCRKRAGRLIQPLKERLVRKVGYGLSLEGASAAALVKSMQAKS